MVATSAQRVWSTFMQLLVVDQSGETRGGAAFRRNSKRLPIAIVNPHCRTCTGVGLLKVIGKE
jgi:hypothetical protein